LRHISPSVGGTQSFARLKARIFYAKIHPVVIGLSIIQLAERLGSDSFGWYWSLRWRTP